MKLLVVQSILQKQTFKNNAAEMRFFFTQKNNKKVIIKDNNHKNIEQYFMQSAINY